ncbi:MAG: uroporphyrinogen-III C-methyltransferase [Thermoprotei archaeon]|nr:uroporphyrinogen-III C-methyltransferase [Thermoprotei archaeon]
MRGKVYIVGGGPGDPGLITVKGLKLIGEADVIVYDRLAPHEVLSEAKAGAIKIYAGKEPGGRGLSQEEINRILVEYASRGLTVVRLKGGDPLVLGRGEEECAFVIEHGIECEIIPGVSSFLAAAASSGVPLTSRGLSSSFAVVTGMEDPSKGFKSVDLAKIASSVDTIVILMGASRSAEILREVAGVRGYEELGVVVMRASMPDEKVLAGKLSDLIEAAERGEIVNPAVIIIGKTVRFREVLKAGKG